MNKYSKEQCLHMDWNNPKEITSKELAYCIVEYDLEREVPEARQEAVQKEVSIYRAIKQKEKVKSAIEEMLYHEEYESYHYDPDLFETTFEVETAFAEEISLINIEMSKTEIYGHQYKDNNHARDLKRAIKTASKLHEELIRLGVPKKQLDAALRQIPDPQLNTLLQDINKHREGITRRFTALGASKTRAERIAIAITTNVYYSLK